MRVVVLRLGHRPERDMRITTHVGLVARAFGAEEMLLAARDQGVVDSLEDVVKRWGGSFAVRHDVRWREEVREFRESGGVVVHLTMYGSRLSEVMDQIRAHDRIMVAVGAEKVPADLYGMADWNVGVGNQPHSEVAALAVFLDRLMEGKELDREFQGQLKIVPTPRGKQVVERSPAGDGMPDQGD
ncbi:MAG: tRNA (cytidine(56)-2'-O)-methyltransferase [Methanosarcinales archaeon]|nr:tRNA (cytidine(56)-2'-O)-methyltransferase [Methanosarcinales archaeon]